MIGPIFTENLLSNNETVALIDTAYNYAVRIDVLVDRIKTNTLDNDCIKFGSTHACCYAIANNMKIVVSMLESIKSVMTNVRVDLHWLIIRVNEAIVAQDWFTLSACSETLLEITREARDKIIADYVVPNK